jgi:hypothetical protein
VSADAQAVGVRQAGKLLGLNGGVITRWPRLRSGRRSHPTGRSRPRRASGGRWLGAIGVGQRIEFTGPGGRKRAGETLDTDRTLLQVGHPLASGQPRTAWIGVMGLGVDPRGSGKDHPGVAQTRLSCIS